LNRHQIESYLIDPRVAEVAGIAAADSWRSAIVRAGQTIRWYQIARWTIGKVRSKLPPNYDLQTHAVKKEYRLPSDLTEHASTRWCKDGIAEFRDQLIGSLNDASVAASFKARAENLTLGLLENVDEVLRWCSGKDLLAAIRRDDAINTGSLSAKGLCGALRDWVLANPEATVNLFPEFNSLREQFGGTV